jgi:hypothetical protein
VKVPVRKFSRGEVNRNKMSKSLLHSRKSQMLADNEQVPSGCSAIVPAVAHFTPAPFLPALRARLSRPACSVRPVSLFSCVPNAVAGSHEAVGPPSEEKRKPGEQHARFRNGKRCILCGLDRIRRAAGAAIMQ